MSRQSSDQVKDGVIWNGFDYNIQAWVKNGIVQDVGLGKEYAGMNIKDVPGHEIREDGYYTYK